MSARTFALPPRAPWRAPRPLQGCLLALVALAGSCFVCARSDAWERFNGSVLWRGSHHSTITGDTAFTMEGAVTASRRSAMAGDDAYGVNLGGPGDFEFVALQTRARLPAGRFRIRRQPVEATRPPPEGFTASLATSDNTDDFWTADSGTVVLTGDDEGKSGVYVAYMTRDFPRDSASPRHIVVRGRMALQPP